MPHWAQPISILARDLGTALDAGLTDREARRRLEEFGPNELRAPERLGLWVIVADQVKSSVVFILGLGAALSFFIGQLTEGAAIVLVLALNTVIGFVTEVRAVRSMEALYRLARVEATVRREGRLLRIAAAEIVPGDVMVLEGGDVITADARVIQSSRLRVDESALTGESVPVGKTAGVVAEDARLGDRDNTLFKGTAIVRGAGQALVVSTGMNTELGRISELVQHVERTEAPIQRRLRVLGRRLGIVSVGFVAIVSAIALATGRDGILVLETAVALTVAAIPEGLPVVATIALARGMWRMAARKALISRLSAVETLGSVTTILTDKTGTLTQNRMEVVRVVTAGSSWAMDAEHPPPATATVRRMLEVAALCSEAEVGPDGSGVGDPLELALLQAARDTGLLRSDLVRKYPEVRLEPFDPALRLMATIHADDGAFRVAVKGAPEEVLRACRDALSPDGSRVAVDDAIAVWEQRLAALGEDGLRVLAVAEKTVRNCDDPVYGDLTFLGLFGLLDPPRLGVEEAITASRSAGVRVVMLTGDHAATACHVARAVGLLDDHALPSTCVVPTDDSIRRDPGSILDAAVVARASPEQKLRILETFQEAGDVVAVLGDGDNDAPALRKADIGVAMGVRGTQTARQAAAMVLEDDDLNTVVWAIQQGRTLFSNIRKFVVYLAGCNLGEILTVGLASALGLGLPILPLQILYLNLVTDVFPALALAVSSDAPDVMDCPPRDPAEPVMGRRQWTRAAIDASVLTAPVLLALTLAQSSLQASREEAVTIAFLTLAFGQLVHVFNMGSGRRVWDDEVTRNPWVWGAVALCTILLVGAIQIPVVASVMRLQVSDWRGWALGLGLGMIPLLVGAGRRLVARPSRPSENPSHR